MEIKSEYDLNLEEDGLGVCSNCCSRNKAETLKTRLIVKTENTEDATTTVREAITLIYGSELLRFDGTCFLCLDCCEILTQLHYLFIQFRDRNQTGANVLVTELGATDDALNDSQGQEIIGCTEHIDSSSSMEDGKDDSTVDNLRDGDGDDEHLLWHRRRSLRRIVQRRLQADAECFLQVTEADPDATDLGEKSSDNTKLSKGYNQSGDEDWKPTGSEFKKRRGRPPKKFVPASNNVATLVQKRKHGRPRKCEVAGTARTVLPSPTRKPSSSKADQNEFNKVREDYTVEGDTKSDAASTSGTRHLLPRGRPRGSKNGISYFDQNSKTYSCPHCGKQAKSSWNVYLHIRSVHERQRPYECSLCQKRFATNEGLANHVRVVHADANTNVKQFNCPVEGCGKSFPYRSSLIIHAMVHNRQLWKFECEHCQRKFKSSSDLSDHKSSHSENRNFACEDCGALFKQRSSLRSHQRCSHSEKYGGYAASKVRCHICQKKFLTPGNMRQHIRSVHDQIKGHQCHLCGKQFSCTSNLKSHLKRFHCLDGAELLAAVSRKSAQAN